MEQKLVIVRYNETIDDGSPYRKFEIKRVPLSKLKLGAEIKISKQRKMNIVKLTDEELTFFIDDQRSYTLNRYWQVLGTVKFDCYPTYCEKDTERFAFYFETEVDRPEPGVYDRVVEIYQTMKENAEDMDIWKNIPLARELMHLLKDCCPLRDEGMVDPSARMSAMQQMTEGYLLSDQDLPRLFLSFYQYWEICDDLRIKEDGEPNNYKRFHNSLGDKLFKFSWMSDPNITCDLYERLFGKDSTLRFDTLQLSPQWEKEVYDIEKETFEDVKDFPRGMGFCFAYWSSKTATAAKHGFRWRSPRVMNPKVRFD